jgi:glycopeptide antibiotics resistance protein
MKKLFIPALVIFIFSQAVMFYLAIIKLNGVGGGQYFSGAMAHFMALFVTAFLIVFTLKQVNFELPYTFAILYCFCAAIAIEFIQLTIPYRTFSFEDMFFGVLGAVTFVVLSKTGHHVHRHLKKRKENRENKENKIE